MKDKIIIAAMLLMTSFFMNAQKKEQVRTLPKEGSEFVATYFKDQKIKSIFKVPVDKKHKYEVTLENGIELELNDRGRWQEVEGNNNAVPFGYLKPATVTYIKTNYGNRKVVEVENGPRFIFVKLDNGVKLQFEAEGKFNRVVPAED